MLKKIITYTDYNGVERTEPFYFNRQGCSVSYEDFQGNDYEVLRYQER